MKNIFLLILITSSVLVSAKTYTSTCVVSQYEGPLDDSDTKQKLLLINLVVGNGGGSTPEVTEMVFALTGFGEVATAYLYETDQSSTYAETNLLASVATPGATLTFNGFTEVDAVNGSNYYWLVIDLVATVTDGTVVDASLTSTTTNTGATFTTTDPTGFRLSGRNYDIGTGEDYADLTTVVSAMTRFDYDGAGVIYFELTDNYGTVDESATVTFTNNGAAHIIIRPKSSATVNMITKTDPGDGNPVIEFSGGSNSITLDGQRGGVGGSQQWTIQNIRTANYQGPAIRYISDASSDTLRYMTLEGETEAGLSRAYGLVDLSTASSGGNDDNVFSYCVFQDLTGGTAQLPAWGITSEGSASNANSGCKVDNCSFIDCLNGTLTQSSASILLDVNCDAWTITNNHFYQTASIGSIDRNAAFILIGSGSGHTITGNFFGGQGTSCSGSAYTLSSGTDQFYGIFFASTCSGGTTNTVSSNTFKNFIYTSTYAALAQFVCAAILLDGSSDFTVGTTGNANQIGETSGTGSVTLTHNGASTSLGFCGIKNNSTGTVSIAYNTFGAFTLNGSRANATSSFVTNAAANTTTVDDNFIGNTTANNIIITSDSEFYGVYNNSGGTNGYTVTDNTFRNVDHNATTAKMTMIKSDVGAVTITGNTISDLNSAANQAHEIIYVGNTTGDISTNTMEDITLSNTGTSTRFIGISITNTGATTMSNNKIGSSTADNILVKGNAFSPIIDKAGAGKLTSSGNRIREVFLDNGGSSVQIIGIKIADAVTGEFDSTNDTIGDFKITTTRVGQGFIGMYMGTTSTSIDILAASIQDVELTEAGAVSTDLYGIWASSTAGGGTIKKIDINGFLTPCTGVNADQKGILIDEGTWDIHNNVIQMVNTGNTADIRLYGIYDATDAAMNYSHNTVLLGGSSSSGSDWSTCFYRLSTDVGTDVVENNAFQNLRTDAGASWAIYNNSPDGTFTSDYNYLEVTDDADDYVGNNDGTEENLATWQVHAANSMSGTTTFGSDGKAPSGFAGDDLANDLETGGTVTDDKEAVARTTTPRAGAFEGDDVLPVELVEFSGYKTDEDYVQLYWVTATEINSDYFEIIKVVDGQEKSLGTVQAAGHSNEYLDYELKDPNPVSGTQYYYLIQYDYDGQSEKFEPIVITLESTMDVSVYPNPLKESSLKLNVDVSGQKEILLIVVNELGQEFYSKVYYLSDGENHFALDVFGNIPAGIYHVTGSSKDELFSKKVIVLEK